MISTTSLTLQALLKNAVSQTRLDTPARLVAGLTASAKALFVAMAAHAMPKGVALYLVPGDVHIEEAVADIRFFLAGVEGMSGGARRDALTKLAGQVAGYSGGSADPQRVQWLVGSIKDLASSTK